MNRPLPWLAVILLATFLHASFINQAASYEHYHLLYLSQEQKNRLKEKSEAIAKSASKKTNDMWAENKAFFESQEAITGKGISKYYGTFRYGWETGPDSTIAHQLDLLDRSYLLEKTVRTDCITIVFDCLRHAYKEHGCEDIFAKIDKFVKANHGGNTAGLPLFEALRKMGWKTYFYMPSADHKDHEKWDKTDNEIHGEKYSSVKGSHIYWFDQVVNKRRNYETNTPVDFPEKLVGFGDETPPQLKEVDFAIGVMNTGYHVFTLHRGMVIEAHAHLPITYKRTIEKAPFNPLKGDAKKYDPAKGGGEGGPAWIGNARGLSGLIVIPPHNVF